MAAGKKSDSRPGKRGYAKPLVIGKHTVQIVELGGAPRLLVDGRRRSYIKAPNGFTLRDAIYDPPAPTLLEAGERFAKQLAARDHSPRPAKKD